MIQTRMVRPKNGAMMLRAAMSAMAAHGVWKRGCSDAKMAGSMPDFAFTGTGIKVSQVAPDSAGEKAGLLAGDVITSFGGASVDNLRAYTNELGKYKPGDTVEVIVERDGKPVTLSMELVAR